MWLTFKKNEWRLYFNEFCCSDTRVITLRKKEVPESLRLKFFENGERPIEVSLIDLKLVKEDEKEMEILKKENTIIYSKPYETKQYKNENTQVCSAYRYGSRKLSPSNDVYRWQSLITCLSS